MESSALAASLNPFVLVLALGCAAPATGGAPVSQDGTAPPSQEPRPDPATRVRLPPPFAPIPRGDVPEHEWEPSLVPGEAYDDAVPTPASLLGRPVGSRLASHGEILAMLRAFAATSDRVALEPYGLTYEGRDLVRLVITSPANHARLDEIRRGARALWDPRGLGDAEGERLCETLPAIAWMGYGIHGDETSASEASVPVAHHLAACLDEDVVRLLEGVVVVLDPCLNPDGRERIRSMVVQGSGYRPSLDHSAMQRGRWPHGRGNHYLFDLNRDWMAGECPETRARWAVLLDLPPHLFVDAHEMSGLDTFLFYPQAPPKNPHLPARLLEWQGVFADDAARAFDAFGWGYYTREWADAWYCGYSDAWGSLNGAIGMLYEQGRTIGAPLERASGEIVPYRETVHGQVVVSLANLATLRAHRTEVLRDYLEHRRRACDPDAEGGDRAYVVVPGADPERHAHLLRTLVGQGVEVFEAREEFEARDAVGALGERADARSFPAGSWIVPAAQPQGALVRAYLEFDPRVDDETLRRERESLERGNGSNVYDVTAWDLGRQLGLDAWWVDAPDVDRAPLTELRAPAGPVGDPSGAYAWVVDGADGRSLAFAARAMEAGLAVHLSDRAFEASVRGGDGAVGARSFPRGSLVLRRHENPEGVDETVARAARETGAVLWSAATGRAPGDGPDLGGGHFELLEAPRVALLGNTPVSAQDFGHAWRYLDAELGVPVTVLDAQAFGSSDLRRYNVLVLPPARGLARALGPHSDTLRDWVRSGGTLVAIGSSAHALAGEPFELTSNVLRRDALDELEAYAHLVRRERAALDVRIDDLDVWGDGSEEADEEGADEEAADRSTDGEDGTDPDAERRDAWMRRFSPAGAVLRARAHPDAWITSGIEGELAVPFSGSSVMLTEEVAAVRLAPAERLRLGGLVWPEARERIADSAWATVEARGAGQVVSFAASPVFRGSWRGTARLLGNAVVLGPGAGARPPIR